MNCQDHLYRNQDPKQVSRRWFIEQCGVGLGAMAFGHLLQNPGFAAALQDAPLNPLAPKKPPQRSESQERHLPFYGRGTQPPGAVRLQTSVGQV